MAESVSGRLLSAAQGVGGAGFRPFDQHLVHWLGSVGGRPNELQMLAAASVSSATSVGDVCVDVRDLDGAASVYDKQGVGLEEWRKSLRAWDVVGLPSEPTPLVLDEADRLYLGRYWRFEGLVAEALGDLAQSWIENIDVGLLRAGLERLFGPSRTEGGSPDWQRVACVVAALRRLCIISGGPGTGKTFTVAAILQLLVDQASAKGGSLRVVLAAPTGKAAARLSESIRSARERVNKAAAVLTGQPRRLPDQAVTLHRLLGVRPGRSRPRHHRGNPLHADVVVVDEASMVDLPLMARLADALAPESRLILLGDQDQLASVEAGSVLGDLCGRGRGLDYSDDLMERIAEIAGIRLKVDAGRQLDLFRSAQGGIDPAKANAGKDNGRSLADSVVLLRKSRRFKADSGIGAFAGAVNRGDLRLAQVISDSGRPDLSRMDLDVSGLAQLLRSRLTPWYRSCRRSSDPSQVLRELSRIRVLCAVRDGPFGVVAVNRLVEGLLADAGLIGRVRIGRESGRHYVGRPILILNNDYATGLFNGDIGVLLPDPGFVEATGEGGLQAWFDGPETPRRVLCGRLPTHETCFAMSVHKAQGSEADEVVLVIPPYPTRALTRELLYTGITRARERVTLVCSPARLADAVVTRTDRRSGLCERLWGET